MKKSFAFIIVSLMVFGACIASALTDEILSSTFEDGKAGDWKAKGNCTVKVTDEKAYKGKRSLLVTKRAESWNGAEIFLSDVLALEGEYKVSVWAMIKDGQPGCRLGLTAQRDTGSKQEWDGIFGGDATPGKWMNLYGEYTPKGDFEKISVYIEASKAEVDFYIDDATITVVKMPPAKKETAKKTEGAKTAHVKKGTPVIDGIEDEVWKNASIVKIDLFAEGKKGSTGTAKMLWDEKNLYVFVKVQDNNLQKGSGDPWEQDSIEIFVDEKNNKSADYGSDDAQYRVNFKNEKTYGGTPTKLNSAAVVTKDGFDVEVAILFKAKRGAVGNKLGFDLQVNDDPGSGKRESIAKWNDPTNDSYRNTSRFGVIELVE